MKIRLIAFALLLAGALLSQTGGDKEIPKFEGDGNSLHDGQQKWCQARDENGFKKNCGICDHKCGDDSDRRCRTFCRSKAACRCNDSCNFTGNKKKSPETTGAHVAF